MIEVHNETKLEIDSAQFADLAKFLYKKLKINDRAILNLIFVGERHIEKLHIEYLNLPGPTDVMSFPVDELTPGTKRPSTTVSSDEPAVLGDIFICPSYVKRKNTQKDFDLNHKYMLLLTHGVLHLLGYDHHEPELKQEMFELQKELLLGYFETQENIDLELMDTCIDNYVEEVENE
ncbi:MAG: rRNA maturation RNase YbeY [Bifidobacteriaceae bacterium]|jgi:probable rRNA maturation factor|nr:rRNA maturation RNase YbeY [Bifidobacteriaceae bacterium]